MSAGFTHFAFDVLKRAGTLVGSASLAAGGFWFAFALAAILSTAHGTVWSVWFARRPSNRPAVAPVVPPAV